MHYNETDRDVCTCLYCISPDEKGEDTTQPQRSRLVNDFLQELCHLSLGAGGSGAYTESVSPAWSQANVAEFGRVEGQGGYGLGCSTLLQDSVGKYFSNVCFEQSIHCAKLLPHVSGALLSPDNFSHEIRLLGKQPEHACYKEQTVTTNATGKGGTGQKQGPGKKG